MHLLVAGSRPLALADGSGGGGGGGGEVDGLWEELESGAGVDAWSEEELEGYAGAEDAPGRARAAAAAKVAAHAHESEEERRTRLLIERVRAEATPAAAVLPPAPAAARRGRRRGSGEGGGAGRGNRVLSREKLLRGMTGGEEEREAVARGIDLADRALATWSTQLSDFLSPSEAAAVQRTLAPLAGLQLLPWGGYPLAERCRLAFARADAAPLEAADVPVALVNVSGNFLFDAAGHGDFLGAALGATGLSRAKIGDVVVQGEAGAQLLCHPDVAHVLEASLTQVRTVPVRTTRAELSELRQREVTCKEVQTVEASLRLDAVASAGFRLSRSKMAGLISSGEVKVNWAAVSKESKEVKAGDTIALRGRGRLEVLAVAPTKSGRFRVHLRLLK
eukprot:tig00020780_g13806.t1